MEPLWLMPTDPPEDGDESDADLQASLGRVLCSWGEIEAHLCLVYCLFVGGLFEREAVLAFGAGRIFKDRALLLEEAASEFFMRVPHQVHEADVEQMIDRARGFASLRNDVAHTVMRPWNWVTDSPPVVGTVAWGKMGWCLLPMYFDPKRFKDARPQYVLTSQRLDSLSESLHRFLQDLVRYRHQWWSLDGSIRHK